MEEETVPETRHSARHWRWGGESPPARFRGPVEMFWRGLGYEVRWQGNQLEGSRDLEGQHRSFLVHLTGPESGPTDVSCDLTFVGEAAGRQPTEIYDPELLTQQFGAALVRGFGAPLPGAG